MNKIVLFAIVASVSSFLNAQTSMQEEIPLNDFYNATDKTQWDLVHSVTNWEVLTIENNITGSKLIPFGNIKTLGIINPTENYITETIPNNVLHLASLTELLHKNNIELIISPTPTRLA